MANKQTKSTKSSPSRGKSSNGKGKKRKKISLTKEIIIIAIVLILVAAIAIGAFYCIAPEKFKEIFNNFFGKPVPTTLEGDILEIRYLDVGQGDCILIRFPDGKTMMIDAGGTKSKDDKSAEDVILQTLKDLKIYTIDYLMATHGDADHVDYLDSVIKETQVNTIYRPLFRSKSETQDSVIHTITTNTYDNFIVAAKEEPNCNIIDNVGKMFIEGEGYKMTIYAPESDKYSKSTIGSATSGFKFNAVSPLCILEYGDRKAVFTGDGESKSGGNGMEEYLIDLYNIKSIDCDVLKVGHHGSEPSSGEALLDIIDVEYAVISAGVGNSHKHPRPELLDRLGTYRDLIPDRDAIGIQRTYRTDLDGEVYVRLAANGGLQWSAA